MIYKAFIKKLFFFLLPLAVLLIFLELKTRQIPSSYDIKRKYFEKVADSIEVLVLGNSHMLHGIDPDYFSLKGFNLASGFQNYYYDKALIEKYINRLKKLKLVFISADYISFYYRIQDVADWIDYGYLQSWDIRHPSLSLRDSRSFSTFMLYRPSQSVKYIMEGDETVLTKNIKQNGYNTEDTSYLELVSEEKGKARALYHTQLMKLKRENENRRYLESLIKTLKQNGVKTVLIAPPVYSTYSRHLDSSYIRRTQSIINGIVSKYNCEYKDYSSDERFLLTDFHDNDHLSYRGAAKFAQILDKDFVLPLVNK